MICELFSFQKQAVNDLRFRVAMALNNYRMLKIPQVVSLQAPTGSGKTIIMSSLIEDIFFGSEQFTEQPDAIFVWLSDSPQLNEQSKQKIELKANRIRLDQCVVISDESFDMEVLEDGRIYFLNTQKLGKAGNLSRHSDTRQYTIWETIENTAELKSDRLYFVIDEAHRGMQGRQAGTATTIMQRFIKGSHEYNLSPIPVVIGMSATAERFDTLVGRGTNSTLHKVIISPAQVRQSGLLKDRIFITYPEDPTKHSDMAVLQAATDEWMEKCKHWYQYTYEQHYSNVNPVFVIQVCAGSGRNISDTDLDDVIAKIEERIGETFKEHEVVHTFGSTGILTIHGLTVPHVEPSEIADDKRIRVVLFKENLSTGWDCPRAETMMSFRRAEDATYIAQLLGRMVRTPLQCHVMVDDFLNDVRLFLPYFNKDTVQKVIDELQATEGGEIPTVIEGESMEEQTYDTWTVHTSKKKTVQQAPGQMSFFDYQTGIQADLMAKPSMQGADSVSTESAVQATSSVQLEKANDNDIGAAPSKVPAATQETSGTTTTASQNIKPELTPIVPQTSLLATIDREGITKFINEQGYLTYMVRTVRINSYLKSLMSLAGLLTQYNICITAIDDVKNDVTELIHNYVDSLRKEGKYDDLMKQVMELKLSVQIFDVFGEAIQTENLVDLFATSETDLDRQLRAADAKMGGCGFHLAYGRKYIDFDNPNTFKIDCILFAFDSECIARLNQYAEAKFHELNDQYRMYIAAKPEKCKKQYSDIVADGDEISKHNFTLPETISAKVENGGIAFHDHLFANAEGVARIKLNSWELGVLEEERKRPDYACWLRNPSRQSWSLRIPYEMEGKCKEMFPDFLIIRKDDQLGYIVDILEPHNPDFKDNLGKAKGLAHYASQETRMGRIQLIRMAKDSAGTNRFKRLELAKGLIRNKVLAAINTDELDHIFDTDGVFED
ncbi:DEAD/DEAH box helicase [Allofournierella sp. CML151]|uniref:DEAD/DEAH box helicase n=1 Tax=Allofournierella sp. CML151 TaxID=2998082 RepID=UPI0022EADD6E|nr:DEAD/DEAH box helicase family protein [Fournierella sp. CML151]